MPYIGNQPTSVPLTASDIADGVISSAKLATLASAMNFQGTASDMRLNFDTTDTVANATPLMAITAKNKTDSVAQLSMRRESAVDDGYIALSTQPTGGAVTERVRIHSNGVMSAANGIALGVGTANTSSNVLDDYEEGTFTPTFIDQNNTKATSYTNNSSASYTKIGNICYVMMDIEFNSIDSSNLSSYAGIGGYPFTCINAQSSMTGQLALYQTEFGNEEFGTTIEHNKANGIFYHNGSTVSPGTIGTQLRAFFNFAYKTA